MAIDYDKYINSKTTHYISNSGSDERGKYNSGKAGDQTGKEWQLKAWYNRPWNYVLRHPDPKVRRLIAELAIEAALNDHIGYDQYQRTTFWQQLKVSGYRPANITVDCEDDCSAGVNSIVKAVGYLLGDEKLKANNSSNSSRNTRQGLKAAGFEVLTDSKYLKGCDYLLPGDVLLYENHHVATNVTRGKYATGEVAEHVDTQEPGTGQGTSGTKPGTAGTGSGTGHTARTVTIRGGNCHIRTGPGTQYGSVGIAKQGESYEVIDTEGWMPVRYYGGICWVSELYAKEQK